MGDHPALGGYKPTITREVMSTEVLSTATLDNLKREFDQGKWPDTSQTLFENLLDQNGTERQKLFKHFEKEEGSHTINTLVDYLAKGEEDPEIMKDIIACLGHFPECEKIFLAHLLDTNEKDKVKFRYLEEVIFSKEPKFLKRFVEAKSDLNKTIIDNLTAKPIGNGNTNITKAVEDVFKEEEPFSEAAEMYQLPEGGRSLKTTYDLCKEKGTRLAFLKNLLLEGNRENNIPLVTKIIFSHCYIDLQSILKKVSLKEEESARISEFKFENTDLSRIKELSCLEHVKGDFLRDLVRKAAFHDQS